MATTAPPPRPARRTAPVTSASTRATLASKDEDKSTGTTLVAKGSVTRTSPTPKVLPPVRRAASISSRPSSSVSNPRERSKGSPSPTPAPGKLKENGIDEGRDELRLRIQDLDSTVSTLSAENARLQTTVAQTEARMQELYSEQARMDQELGVRFELAEKLRAQLRDLEKEKRELARRYKEQTATFDAERQSFYDNEQHLKSRIQALSQARKEEHKSPLSPLSPRKSRYPEMDETASIVSEAEFPVPSLQSAIQASQSISTTHPDDDTEPAEMTSLKLELSTLSTSHASLQSTLQLLQSQLLDLQRVNSELQEENEGWKVLVQQRTLAGTFDVLGLGGARDGTTPGDEASSMRSTGRNTLDKVPEADESAYEVPLNESGQPMDGESLHLGIPARGQSLEAELAASDLKTRDESPSSRRSGRRRGKALGEEFTDSPKGETLADLPITGPGLDLAAELGRAQNAEGFADGPQTAPNIVKKSPTEIKLQSEVNELKAEVRSLKDANKALSLYASKIIDRIIATEGFENVLAVDFTQKLTEKKRKRPVQMIFGDEMGKVEESPKTPVPTEKLTTFQSIGMRSSTSNDANNTSVPPPVPPKPAPPPPAEDAKRSRRSMSFDWRGFSLFGGGSQPSEPEKKTNPSLKPLALKPGAPSLTTPTAQSVARKLDTVEDEDDRRERERLRATMRLMGIEPGQQQMTPPQTSSTPESGPPTVTATTSSRWSIFGKKDAEPVSTSGSSSSLARSHSASPMPPVSLTTEALHQAEAESHLAALDAREKVVKEDIAKGSASGFTELTRSKSVGRRRIGEEWRSRRSSSALGEAGLGASKYKEGSDGGSASTVWSAGKDDD